MQATYSKTITATDNAIFLGNGSDTNISTFTVSLTAFSGTSMSIVPKGRLHASGIAAGELVALAYTIATTGALTSGATPITAEGIYFIRADGMDVYLDTTLVSASVRIDAVPLNG